MLKTFEYRLYPNRRQQESLMACLEESRRLYNAMLEQVKDYHAESGKFLSKYALTARFKRCGGEYVPATTVQTLADRLDKALRRCIARKELGQKVGFPRFKSANRWHSIHLRQYGKSRDVWLDDRAGRGPRLRVPGKLGKTIKIRQHRPLEGVPKTVYLKLRADGKWYVLIVCKLGDVPPQTTVDEPAIGLDVGLKVFLADSDGRTVTNPRHYQRSQKNLRRAQRKGCRRKKGSKGRKKAARAVAKTHLKIARQRKDFLHKTAKRYVDDYSRIVVEELNVFGMIKNHTLAKSIHDASWAKFVEILEYKAESAGAQVVKVPAHFTTQACSNCGELVPKSLSVRTHICTSCEHVEDRDVNAAKNILDRARAGPSEGNVKGCLERAPRSRLL
jgi:putative transposase